MTAPAPRLLWILTALALGISLLLIPGFYSHDELQWIGRALEPSTWGDVGWIAFADLAAFQYRPLSFNLWLLLARATAGEPIWIHAVFAGFGVLLSWQLVDVLRRFGVATDRAWRAGALFLILPTTVFTLGWTGTLADLLVLALALLMLQSGAGRRLPVRLVLVVIATSLALCAKESALVFPLVAALLGLDQRGKLRFAPTLVAAIPVLVYLLMRQSVFASAGHTESYYDWSLAHVPARLFEYLVFLPIPGIEEAHTVRFRSTTTVLFALALVVLVMLRRGRAGGAIGWLGPWWSLALIGPALTLPLASAHFAFVAGAGLAAWIAAAAAPKSRAGRGLDALVLLLVVWHSVNVLRMLHRDAGVQAQTLALVGAALRDPAYTTESPLCVEADAAIHHAVARSVHDLPHWRGVAFGARLGLVPPEAHCQSPVRIRISE